MKRDKWLQVRVSEAEAERAAEAAAAAGLSVSELVRDALALSRSEPRLERSAPPRPDPHD